jgi:GH15 family glucan-1,4-alpha-glucosidase
VSRRAYPPISDYALLSDCHSAALVSRDGSIDWCCFDRFDARPVFSRILDWSRGGHFRIRPKCACDVERRYMPGTNVVETRFAAETGILVLTDCLAVHERAHRDAVDPYRQLIRTATCTEGEVEVQVDFEPRFDYGLTTPRLRVLDDRMAVLVGGADALVLQSDLGIAGSHPLRAGERAHAVLTYARPHQLRPQQLSPGRIARRVAATLRFWREWSGRCTYEGPYREQVLRSALVLKGLTNAPTGALVAAPTTSLPEEIGGRRNWDYRYTWLRDSAFILYALNTLGYTDEARAFIRWLERTVAGRADHLQVLYGVGGERMLPEIELHELDGYRGSRPVRIGNAAARQFQLDIYGDVVDTIWLYHRYGGRIGREGWEQLVELIDRVEERWTEPDEGIWEVRGEPQHFVYSKVMAWVAVDRAIRLARRLAMPCPLERWEALRRTIRERIEGEGVDPESGAFVQAFGGTAVDASALLIPEVGFVPRHDPRVRATVDRIERELCRDGFVYRYLDTDDGLPGGEGAFLICSFWLVDNLVFSGRRARACDLFERLISHANDVGLLAEQFDPVAGEQLGNFPQAFSHMGLINSAIQLGRPDGEASPVAGGAVAGSALS